MFEIRESESEHADTKIDRYMEGYQMLSHL